MRPWSSSNSINIIQFSHQTLSYFPKFIIHRILPCRRFRQFFPFYFLSFNSSCFFKSVTPHCFSFFSQDFFPLLFLHIIKENVPFSPGDFDNPFIRSIAYLLSSIWSMIIACPSFVDCFKFQFCFDIIRHVYLWLNKPPHDREVIYLNIFYIFIWTSFVYWWKWAITFPEFDKDITILSMRFFWRYYCNNDN